MTKESQNIRRLAVLAMLTAAAYVSVALIRVPVVPAAPFLEFEPKDCLIAIGGFLFGPMAAVCVSVLVSLAELFTISNTGWIGMVMNILSTVLFVCPAAIAYKRHRTLGSALVGLLIGVGLMTGGMLLWNYLITPLYMGMPREAVAAMLLPVFLPFNLLKGGINAALTMLLYKAAVTALRRARLLPEPPANQAQKTGFSRVGWMVWIGAALVLCTLILLCLVWNGIL